ncbi:MMPL family transporter [Cryobacterium sp. 1639]|uniref:MMPL family transporter n=1 Tax=Cryobacterium inferilacus TaxID=2866629 RepID=UPI001C7378F6|nr:MMPL family transporter [Cryobacterium sp. 1639]MBX0300383.1 MMPL family transporter [Cryobacterium sp. 1639]
MHTLLERYGVFAASHPWRVVVVFLAVVGLVAGFGLGWGQSTDDTVTLPGSESTAAQDLLNSAFPDSAKGSGTIVFSGDAGAFSSADGTAALQSLAGSIAGDDHVTQAVLLPTAISSDGSVAYISVSFDVETRGVTPAIAQAVLDTATDGAPSGATVLPGGQIATTLAAEPTHGAELVGLIAAAVILLLSLGTAVAMALPILTALLGLVFGLGAIALLSRLDAIPTVSGTIAAMLSLGVGIDYSLFLITKFRTVRATGAPIPVAAGRAMASSGSAIVFAGVTVMVALAGLVLAGVPYLNSLAWVAAAGVACALLTCLILLPAVLGLLGDGIERLALPRRTARRKKPGVWHRIGAATSKRPWWSLAGSVVVLAALAFPVTALQLGQTDDGNDPTDRVTRQSYDVLSDAFGAGVNGPLLVITALPTPEPSDQSVPADPALAALTTAFGSTDGVASVVGATVSDDGTAAQWSVIPTTAPSDPKTATLVETLRNTVIPGAEGDLDPLVGGQTAAKADFAGIIDSSLLTVIIAVIAASAVLLFFAFRSLAIPLTAAAMNVVSILVAYGVLVFVFQQGNGIQLTGLDAAVPIEAYVPLLLFAVLFGLSMDYEVFLISAIQESWHSFADNRRAVVHGIGSTGRVITSAALIMVSVFISFVPNPDPVVKMFGVGLAVAVLVDATLVRGVLVPAVMTVLGRANWWLPRWLDKRMPHLTIEG